MAAVNNKGKVQASSLLEVLIAMVTILVVFGIAMMIFTNVTNMSLSARKLQAESMVRKTLLLTEQMNDPTNQTLNEDGLRIEVSVNDYPENNALNEVSITAYDENQQLMATAKKLIPHWHE